MKIIKEKKHFDMKKFVPLFLASLCGAMISLGVYVFVLDGSIKIESIQEKQNAYFTSKTTNSSSYNSNLPFADFADVAEAVTPAVVKINVMIEEREQRNYYFDFFDNAPKYRKHERRGLGSGVILTPDGYVVTNNHVIDNASKIEVVLSDNQVFEAEVIGKDVNTDLALLKIEADNLPIVKLGDSDALRVGEWVLAVGNPFDLYSTVTAGIVSAKARNIGLLNNGRRNQYAIESFIQTDAAINRGNSGGALVNARGELIGICTAIASNSGSYVGYGFAVPINLAKKIVEDFKKYGNVKRGFLGVMVTGINNRLKEEYGLSTSVGVYVSSVIEGGAAEKAGLKEGDVITEIDGVKVKTVSEMLGLIGGKSPGEEITINYQRDEKNYKTIATLIGEENEDFMASAINPQDSNVLDKLGISLRPLTRSEKNKYKVSSGVMITSMKKNTSLYKYAGLVEGMIILKVNNQEVSNMTDVLSALSTRNDQLVTVSGIAPDGKGRFSVTVPVS